jgi:general stress protein 26
MGRLRMFLTTYGEGGRSGTVPVFFLAHEGKVYFTTLKATRKARRIKKNPRVTVRFGARSARPIEGRAVWVEDPALYDFILSRYRRKYWFLSPLFVRALRRRKESGESAAVEIVFGEEAQP